MAEREKVKKPESPDFTPYNIPLDKEFQAWLQELCQSSGVDYSIVISIAEKESNFRPKAISTTDDYGMWQINKINHATLEEELGRELDMMNSYDNAESAVWILSRLMKKCDGDREKVLMAYNMGETGASRLWEKGITKSRYSDSVLAKAYWYENNYFIAKTSRE